MTANDSTVLKIGIHIHINTESQQQNINVEKYNAYFECAQYIENLAINDKKAYRYYTSVVWYVVSNSLPLQKAIATKYGIKVLTTTHNENHNTTSSIADIAASWWLLGEARYQVIPRHSSFGHSAGMRSLYRNSIYSVATGGRNEGICKVSY